MDAEEFEETIITFLNDEVPITSAGIFASEATNYDVWGGHIRVRDAMQDDFAFHPVKSCRDHTARSLDHDCLPSRVALPLPARSYRFVSDQGELTDEASSTIQLRYLNVKVLLSARFELEYEKGIRSDCV